jgi:hypothetical protein
MLALEHFAEDSAKKKWAYQPSQAEDKINTLHLCWHETEPRDPTMLPTATNLLVYLGIGISRDIDNSNGIRWQRRTIPVVLPPITHTQQLHSWCNH